MAKNKKDVDLYNSKFVHFEWSEDLKGKDGFFVDDIETLKEELRNKGPSRMGTVLHYSGNEACPFVVKSRNSGGAGGWRFFYYDPNYEVKWAYFKEGKGVQYRDGAGQWTDIAPGRHLDYFDDDYKYRIKPIEIDVKILVQPSVDSFHMTINGKLCTFDNVEDARKVLGLDKKEVGDE